MAMAEKLKLDYENFAKVSWISLKASFLGYALAADERRF